MFGNYMYNNSLVQFYIILDVVIHCMACGSFTTVTYSHYGVWFAPKSLITI